jgi:hypothetical protein
MRSSCPVTVVGGIVEVKTKVSNPVVVTVAVTVTVVVADVLEARDVKIHEPHTGQGTRGTAMERYRDIADVVVAYLDVTVACFFRYSTRGVQWCELGRTTASPTW